MVGIEPNTINLFLFFVKNKSNFISMKLLALIIFFSKGLSAIRLFVSKKKLNNIKKIIFTI